MTTALRSICIAWSAAFAFGSASADEKIQTHEISSAMNERLNALEQMSPPPRPLDRTTVRVQSKSGKIDAQIETKYGYLQRGAWSVGASFAMGSHVMSSNRSISICGMFDALFLSGTNITSETRVPISAAKGTTLLALESTVTVSNKMTMTDLSVDIEKVCAPRPAQSYSFTSTTETEISSSAAFSSPRIIKASVQGTCDVAGALEAAALHPKLTGQYLPVACSGKNQDGREVGRRYAFLMDSGIHLLLNSRTELDEISYTIVDLDYVNEEPDGRCTHRQAAC